jgi:hypothetical protein
MLGHLLDFNVSVMLEKNGRKETGVMELVEDSR